MKRYLENQVKKDLAKKMVFIGGPRQVGKTTISKNISSENFTYLNWDSSLDREIILKQEFPDTKLLIFDEIHKYKRWRNFLKGYFDKNRDEKQILVTGSARLDFYRYGGDSLQGRYHHLRLHPLSYAELKMSSNEDLMTLLNLGGFPEPFLGGTELEAKRWSREYRGRLIREEITSIEQIKDLGTMEQLMLRLPELVASPLSINSLREDLEVSFKAVARWIEILERFYSIFRLSTFGSPKIKALKKEQKHYHYDWTLVPTMPERFENLVAMHLLKWVNFEEDTKGRDLELRYFRDQEKREVDFIVTENRKPIIAIECKWSDDDLSPHLKYFKNKFPETDSYQLTAIGKRDYVSDTKIRVMPAIKFLKGLV